MEKKSIIEKFKEQEKILNVVAEALGFSINISIDSKNTASLRIYERGEKVTSFEILNIEVKSQLQLIVRKRNEVLANVLYYKYLVVFIYNYLNYQNIKFIYQFKGRKIQQFNYD